MHFEEDLMHFQARVMLVVGATGGLGEAFAAWAGVALLGREPMARLRGRLNPCAWLCRPWGGP